MTRVSAAYLEGKLLNETFILNLKIVFLFPWLRFELDSTRGGSIVELGSRRKKLLSAAEDQCQILEMLPGTEIVHRSLGNVSEDDQSVLYTA